MVLRILLGCQAMRIAKSTTRNVNVMYACTCAISALARSCDAERVVCLRHWQNLVTVTQTKNAIYTGTRCMTLKI